MLGRALQKIDTDDDDWAPLSALGNHLRRTDPSFDSRTYGFGKLSELVRAQAFVETRTVSGTNGNGQLWVRRKRRGPADERATEPPAKKTAKRVAKKVAHKVADKAAVTPEQKVTEISRRSMK